MTVGGDLVTAIALVLAGIVWLVRLEGRISRAEERHTELRNDLLTWKAEATNSREIIRRDLKDDIRSIHKRLDAGKVFVFKRSPAERGEDDDT